jgi:hypothetical protein
MGEHQQHQVAKRNEETLTWTSERGLVHQFQNQ